MGNLGPTLLNAAVVAVFGVIILYYLKDRFDQVDKRFAQVDRQLAEVHDRFGIVHEELRQLRSEVFQVAVALGVKKPRPA